VGTGAPPPADPAPAPPTETVRRIGYVPGFDGIRGAGLLLTLSYHHGVTWIPGGPFMISLFFTLSGFLIARLAYEEVALTSRFSVRGFLERRARRLLPAAILTLLGIMALEAIFGIGGGDRFRGDILAALGYVANWRLAYSGADYANLFSLGSPVQHFWSLAVEEQFYVAFPVLVLALRRFMSGRWTAAGMVLLALAAASFAAAWQIAGAQGSTGLAYYATYTRASEILVGVALAFLLRGEALFRLIDSRRGGRILGAAGIAGIGLMAFLMTRVSLSDPRFFRGGTIVNALCSVAIILACVYARRGVVARILELQPFVLLGKLTYSVYLVHWPLYLLLDRERTGLEGAPLFALRFAVTIAVSMFSYHLVEAPFRTRSGRWSTGRLTTSLAVPALATALLVLVMPVRETDNLDLGELDSVAAAGNPDVVVPVDGRPATIEMLLLGDSTAWSLTGGFERWNRAHDEQVRLDLYFSVGCTLATAGPVLSLGQIEHPLDTCTDFRSDLQSLLAANDYDVIMVMMGQKDLSEREIDGEFRSFGDPAFDEWWLEDVGGIVDILQQEATPVVWSTAAYVRVIRPTDIGASWDDYPDNAPARVDRLNELLRQVVDDRPGMIVADINRWLHEQPGGDDDRELRGDGAHWFEAGSEALVEWLMPQLLAATNR
jgi:peptidoglycan/LPS O-acetylase OafA/YrhL